MVELLPSMHKALHLIPNTIKKKWEKKMVKQWQLRFPQTEVSETRVWLHAGKNSVNTYPENTGGFLLRRLSLLLRP